MRLGKYVSATLIATAAVSSLARAEEAKPVGLAWGADFRYRFEWIDDSATSPQVETRNRVRARVGASGEVVENIKVGFQLQTNLTDPVSGNTTLGNSFQKLNMGFSQAYFQWHAANALDLTFGKQVNPFYMPGGTELVWDADLNPEGVNVAYAANAGAVKLDADLGAMFVSESLTNPDVTLAGAQLGARLQPADAFGLRVGAGYFSYLRIEGAPTFSPGAKGNTAVAGKYSNGYNLLDANLTVDFKAGEAPLLVLFDFVDNTSATTANTGWLAGIQYGKVNAGGDFAARYDYRRVEADATVGAFNDSDFGGGGTNVVGHKFAVDYGLAKNFKLSATYFLDQKGVTSGTDYSRGQLDLLVKI